MVFYIYLKTDNSYKIVNVVSSGLIKNLVSSKYVVLDSKENNYSLYLNPDAGLVKKKFNSWVKFIESFGFDVPYLFGDVMVGKVGGFSNVDVSEHKKTLSLYTIKG